MPQLQSGLVNASLDAASRELWTRLSGQGVALWRLESSGGPTFVGAPAGDAAWATPAISGLALKATEEVSSPVDGLWIVTVRGKRRARWVVAVMGVAFLSSEAWRAACTAANVNLDEANAVLGPFATHDERTAKRFCSLLRHFADSCDELVEQRQAVKDFTSQLTDSYEMVDLLYAVGRAMDDPERPDQFVDLVCDRLIECRDFMWCAAAFFDRPEFPPSIAGSVLRRGQGPSPILIGAALREYVDEHSTDESAPSLIIDAPQLSRGKHPQMIIQPLFADGHAAGAIICGDRDAADPAPSSYDTHVVESAARYLSAYLTNSSLYAAQKAMFIGTIRALSASIDAKDRYTQGHSERVAHLAKQLALASGVTPAEADRIHISGLVHDVGKIGVPEAVLCKQGRLTDEEFGLIKKHPEIGYRILEGIPLLADILPGVLHHHEKYDGSGYPHKLAGENIPKVARIMAVADTFDAMSSTRSYRAALPRTKALSEILRGAGTQFDPELAQIFVQLDLSEFDRMVGQHEANLKAAA